jgi:3',5'-cyclic AMP phosphodiesterase CpdA
MSHLFASNLLEKDLRQKHIRRKEDRLKHYSEKYNIRRQLRRLGNSPLAADQSCQFAVIGDAEPGRLNLIRRVLDAPSPVFLKQMRVISHLPVDFVVQLGDMVTRATERNFLTFFRTLERSGLKKAFLTVIGNHDRRCPHGVTDSVLYRSIFGRNNYFFDRGPARIIVLDTSDGRLSKRQLRWLEHALKTEKRTLVFTHMPPITDGTIAASHSVLRFSGFTEGAEEFTDIVAKHKADRVYFGHMHGFGTLIHKGVRYVLSGGGGSPLWPSPWIRALHHYLTIRVTPGGIEDTVHTTSGYCFPVESDTGAPLQ